MNYRYMVLGYEDLTEDQLGEYYGDLWSGYLVDTETGEILMSDDMQPEDAVFYRALSPLIELVDKLQEEIADLKAALDA